MVVASEIFDVRLQVGRWLRGPLLAIVVSVRNMLTFFVTDGGTGEHFVAPACVVVTRRADGQVVGKIAADRELGSGEAKLAAVREHLSNDAPDEFVVRYRLTS